MQTTRSSWGNKRTPLPWARIGSFSAALLALIALGSLSAERAAAQSETKTAGFDFFLDAAPHIVIQSAKGSAFSNFGVTSDRENFSTIMTFRLGGGLRGPVFKYEHFRARPVIWGAALLPLNESSAIGTSFIESAGVGSERLEFSKYSIEYKTSAVAGLGLEFIVPIFDFDVSITPSVESLHLEARYAGNASLEAQSGLDQIEISVQAKQDLTQHFLGPGLRIGTPTIQLRGVKVDFWVAGSVLIDVSGSRKVFQGANADGDLAVFSFETGSSAYQVNSGLALRWP